MFCTNKCTEIPKSGPLNLSYTILSDWALEENDNFPHFTYQRCRLNLLPFSRFTSPSAFTAQSHCGYLFKTWENGYHFLLKISQILSKITTVATKICWEQYALMVYVIISVSSTEGTRKRVATNSVISSSYVIFPAIINLITNWDEKLRTIIYLNGTNTPGTSITLLMLYRGKGDQPLVLTCNERKAKFIRR